MTSILQQLPTHERRLENGLTVIVREDHSAPVVAVVTHVKAGYFDEPDELIGISHVLEHMYFKGTEQRGVGQIARETKAAGGYLNAGTIYDHTSYYTVLPAASLEQALDIQSDALQRSAIDDEELRKELLVIMQEAKRKLDNPGAVAQEKLFEAMFDVHRIRRWRIGTEEVLRGFERRHVWEYYRNLYRAANTIVVIAGDVEPAHAFDLAARYYGAMPGGEVVRSAGAAEPPRRGFRYREIEGDIGQTHSEWGWRTPGTLHEDTPALDVLAVALGQGRASRLYRHVRDAGLVSGISAYNYTPTSLGIFGISAELDPLDTTVAFRRMADVVRAVLADGFTGDEAARARNILEARVIRRLETAEGQANIIADWEALGDWRQADAYLAAVLAVTPQQLHDVAVRYLQPDALTALVYRPRNAPVVASDAQQLYLECFGSAEGAASAFGAGAAAAESAAVTGASAVRAASAPLKHDRIQDGVWFYTVDDGRAHIVIKPRATAPLVSMSLVCRGGVLSEHVPDAGLTSLMSRVSVKGTTARTGVQLATQSEALGGSISPGVSADTVDWSMSVPSRHFDTALELLLDTALNPAFDVEQTERERKIALSDIEQMRDDMYQYPMRLALAEAFGGHPYGFSLPQLEEGLRAADAAALREWHRARVLCGGATFFAVGDISDPDRAAGMVATALRARLERPVGADVPVPSWPASRVEAVEQRDKAQTAIVLAFPGPPRNHPDVHPLQVMSSAIAGLGGRLFEELRSRRSLAYAVSASPLPRWLGGAFVAYIGTAPEREAEARTELMRELLRCTDELLDENEVERARRYLIGSWQIRQQTHSRQLSDLVGAILLGSGLAELREFEERIRAVTAEEIRAAAARWLQPDRVVEGIVRGRRAGATTETV